MDWKLDKDRPIVPQICEQMSVRIAKGDFAPDEKLMSVREVAVGAGINPNTVQKAFEELERQGMIYSVRGSGWYVGADFTAAKRAVEDLIFFKTDQYFKAMESLGYDLEATKNYIGRWKA